MKQSPRNTVFALRADQAYLLQVILTTTVVVVFYVPPTVGAQYGFF